MKIQQIVLLNLLIAAALGCASMAGAQTPPTSDQAKDEMKAQMKDPLQMQGSSGGEWNTLKGHEKGFLEKADADPNSWLAHNFENCDKDMNGKVTEDEYTKCLTH